jgi:hypothetical protein
VPEVKDLDRSLRFMYPVIDEQRAVEQLAHASPSGNGGAHAGKSGEQIQVI